MFLLRVSYIPHGQSLNVLEEIFFVPSMGRLLYMVTPLALICRLKLNKKKSQVIVARKIVLLYHPINAEYFTAAPVKG